jgi:hypothetical protein
MCTGVIVLMIGITFNPIGSSLGTNYYFIGGILMIGVGILWTYLKLKKKQDIKDSIKVAKIEEQYDEIVEISLLDYLRRNQGQAFTVQALVNRMGEYITGNEAQTYCRKVIGRKLDRFFIQSEIERVERNGVMHYLVE